MIKKMIMDESRLREVLGFSQINLPETEFKTVLSRVNAVFRMCDEMQELDCSNVTSFEWDIKKSAARRIDNSKKWNKRDVFLDQAPVVDGDFFRVPRIISLEEDDKANGICEEQ